MVCSVLSLALSLATSLVTTWAVRLSPVAAASIPVEAICRPWPIRPWIRSPLSRAVAHCSALVSAWALSGIEVAITPRATPTETAMIPAPQICVQVASLARFSIPSRDHLEAGSGGGVYPGWKMLDWRPSVYSTIRLPSGCVLGDIVFLLTKWGGGLSTPAWLGVTCLFAGSLQPAG